MLNVNYRRRGKLPQEGKEQGLPEMNEPGLNEELEKLPQEVNVADMLMKNKEDELNAVIGNLKEHNASLESNLKKAESEKLENLMQLERNQELISDLNDRLADAERKITEGEDMRRHLLNEVLELKGNIRVFCRVRPPSPEDGSGLERLVISYPNSPERRYRGVHLIQDGQKHQFKFDRVFKPDASQNDVFVEISQLVQSALDGNNGPRLPGPIYFQL